MRTSLVEAEFKLSDQLRFFVPCPFCSGAADQETGFACDDPNDRSKLADFQVIEWNDGEADHGIKFKLPRARPQRRGRVVPVHPRPEARIDQVGPDKYLWRQSMDRNGTYIPEAPGGEWTRVLDTKIRWVQAMEETNAETGLVTAARSMATPGTIGMRIWAGYNPVLTWNFIATEFLKAKRKGGGALQVFTNNILGRAREPKNAYKEIDNNALLSRCIAYPAEVPDDVFEILASIDVQEGEKNNPLKPQRLEIGVWGFGRYGTRYLVGHWVIAGTIGSPELDARLDEFLGRSFVNQSGIRCRSSRPRSTPAMRARGSTTSAASAAPARPLPAVTTAA
jgi:phage terminase large subunit GpA-like protein